MLEQDDWLQTELEELTSSPEGFHVKTSPLQENAQVCQVSAAACGPSFSELSLKFDPVGQSLRMSLGLELSALTKCSLTWQEQVTPLGRWWWVLSMPERRTGGSGFGLLPTIKASDGRTKGNGGNRKSPGLDQMAKAGMLPTPTARDWKGMQGRSYKGEAQDLTAAVTGNQGGHLSPCFVEWMQGYPVGWTGVSD